MSSGLPSGEIAWRSAPFVLNFPAASPHGGDPPGFCVKPPSDLESLEIDQGAPQALVDPERD
jgi:hypothetical protein